MAACRIFETGDNDISVTFDLLSTSYTWLFRKSYLNVVVLTDIWQTVELLHSLDCQVV